MTNSEFLLETTKIILITILIVLIGIVNFKINQKLDKLIELNTPEYINFILDKPLLEDK